MSLTTLQAINTNAGFGTAWSRRRSLAVPIDIQHWDSECKKEGCKKHRSRRTAHLVKTYIRRDKLCPQRKISFSEMYWTIMKTNVYYISWVRLLSSKDRTPDQAADLHRSRSAATVCHPIVGMLQALRELSSESL